MSWQEGKVVVFRVGFSLCLVAERVLEKKTVEIELKLWSCFGELRVSGVEVLSIIIDDWKRGFLIFFFFWFTVFVGVKSEIRVRMFVEWEIVFGWLETCVEREEKEGNLGFWADRKKK